MNISKINNVYGDPGRGSSMALILAVLWTAILHICLGITGTFVLKRFPTQFSIGFLLGLLCVTINQNIIMFGTFYNYHYGETSQNHVFANFTLMLAVALAAVTALLYHFRNDMATGSAASVTSKDSTIPSPSNNQGRSRSQRLPDNANGGGDYAAFPSALQ
jgi:hypothetical protein